MFRSLKRKTDPQAMFDDNQWRVYQGKLDGEEIIVRVNGALKPFAGRTEHNLKIGFAIPLNSPSPGRMPNPEENALIDKHEDRIFEVLRSKGSVVRALTITMGTFKEYIYYALPSLDVKSAHEQLMAEIDTHEVQCIARIEKDWATYKEWDVV